MNRYRFRIRLLPVILFTAVVFLVVKSHPYHIDINDMPNIPLNSSMELWDVFCYKKAQILLVLTLWAMVTMAYLLIIGHVKIKKSPIYIPMAVYALGVLISYILSDYKGVSWLGNVDRFEGTRTILCYIFMLFYTINVVDEIRDAVVIVSTTAIGVFAACVIGMTQLLGRDFFLTDIGRTIIAGDKSVEAQFKPGQVYQTVSNMNYVGMYLVLITPILILTLYYMISKKGRGRLHSVGIDGKKRIRIGLFTVLLLILIAFNEYGAGSLGGILGIATAIAVMIIILCKKKWQKYLVSMFFLLGLVGSITYIYAKGIDTNKLIDYIQIEVDVVKISIDGNKLNIIYDRENDQYRLDDGIGRPLSVFCFAEEEGVIRIDSDERYSEKLALIPVRDFGDIPCIILLIKGVDDQPYSFKFYEDGAKYINPYGEEVSLDKIDSWGFEGHLSSGSGRGYIWSRTIPLLNRCLVTGFGADTFMLVFPQDDYAGRYSSGRPLNVYCDKPHNMYLNIAVGTGIVSLFAFITMVGMALNQAFRLSDDKIYIKIIAAGIIGFLFSGLVNDSSICVMPMFYGFLGTMIGVCQLSRLMPGRD